MKQAIALKLLESEPEVRAALIRLAGGSEAVALHLCGLLGLKVSAKDAAGVLGLTPSGSRKRLAKIKRLTRRGQ